MDGGNIGGFVVLVAVIAGGLLIHQLKLSYLRRQWTRATGTVSTCETRKSCGDDTPDQLFAAVTYTYRVRGKMYWGEFQEIVEDERAALLVFHRFPKGSPIALLHDPKRPELSCRLAQR